jgi:hypothetical protein
MRLVGRFPTKVPPARKALGLLVMIVFGYLLSLYLSRRVESDACRDGGGTWIADTKTCQMPRQPQQSQQPHSPAP